MRVRVRVKLTSSASSPPLRPCLCLALRIASMSGSCLAFHLGPCCEGEGEGEGEGAGEGEG